ILQSARFSGVLRVPPAKHRPAVVILVPGLDSSKVEFQYAADALLRRGLACLAIDGPGQGEHTPSTTMDSAYHRVISDAVDALTKEDAVNGNRVGVLGMSLGGFYTATALAQDPRIAAGSIVSGLFRLRFDQAPPYVAEVLALRCGGEGAARAFADHIDLSHVATKIRQPLRVIEGGRDDTPGVTPAHELAELARRGELLLVEEGDHLLGNTTWRWLPGTADWFADRLRVPAGPRNSPITTP
ncbi:MAG: alpha/beta hydrolase family protein, partial [Stackebrandtia sp.]